MQLEDFVKVYHKVIPKTICEYFIDFFERNEQQSTRYDGEVGPIFNQIDFTAFSEENRKFTYDVARMINSYAVHYVQSLGLQPTFPTNVINEDLRIKKYSLNDKDRFPLHIDADTSRSSVRCLAMLLYLNDVEEGGETIFPNLDLKIKPTKGSLLIFPPTWMFPHIGSKPISNEKYILSTYWHIS